MMFSIHKIRFKYRIVGSVLCSKYLNWRTFSDSARMKVVYTWGIGTEGQLGHKNFNLVLYDILPYVYVSE